MSAIGYVRVSTDKQDNSVSAQRRRIELHAELHGLILSEVIIDEDEFSGNLDRPGVQRLLDLVKAKAVQTVIITKLDRLTRSTRDAIDLIELFGRKDVALVSIGESLDTASPMGRFFVRMIASIAELEREMIASRTAAGMQELRAKGMPAGKAPYGWRNVGKRKPMEAVASEQSAIKRIKELRATGMSLATIATVITDEGMTTREGTPWVFQYVARVLKTGREA
jgi:site-specific DNA recombinase